jgi:hypothetical protein
MTVLSGLDAAGRRRSPATLPGYHAGRPPITRGSDIRIPAQPARQLLHGVESREALAA